MSGPHGQVVRYVLNGLVATAVHYSILSLLLEVGGLGSAGVANLIAVCFGIVVSFLGSRFFVFPGSRDGIVTQAVRFSSLYAAIALLHGLTLYILTDRIGVDYRLAFLVATAIQVTLSYTGNKYLVFRA